MPVYLQCPHCEHPIVVPSHRRGKTLFCRQCGGAYRTSTRVAEARPLPISSVAELHKHTRTKAIELCVLESKAG